MSSWIQIQKREELVDLIHCWTQMWGMPLSVLKGILRQPSFVEWRQEK